MNKDPVKYILARLKRLEKAVFGSRPKEDARKTGKGSSRGGLPAHLLNLRDSAFFKEPRTVKETHAKIQSNYPCDLNRVAVALLRLQKRRQLRKTSKGVGDNKQVAYVW